MTSVTSGTTSFNLDVDEIIEQAIELLGGEHQSGIDASKARRTLNLVLIMLQNKNIPLSKLDFVTQALVNPTTTYMLSSDIVDVLDCAIEYNNIELPIERISVKQYQNLPIKNQTSRPLQYFTERKADEVSVTFWPIPDVNYTAKLLVSKKVEDITASYQRIDISTRYLPLLVAWLAYELSKSKVGIGEDIKNRLKMDYLELLPDTFDEDRERVDLKIVPGGINGL